MSQPPPPVPPTQPDALQFDTAEPSTDPGAAPSVPTCTVCNRPIADIYYAAGDQVVCPECRAQYIASREGGSRLGRLAKAMFLGIIAAAIGAAIWFGIRRMTGYEIGLIAIVVGFLVGGAVRAGSGGRGGRGYQVLAVLLTYFGICANYMPDVYTGLRDAVQQRELEELAAAGGAPATQPADSGVSGAEATPRTGQGERPSASGATPEEMETGGRVLGMALFFLFVFAFSLAAPFLGGAQNIIGLLIIGFALWEAWKMNTRSAVDLAGPYALGDNAGGPPPSSTTTGVA